MADIRYVDGDGHLADAENRAKGTLVRIESLRLFPDIVRSLGGKPEELLAREHLDTTLLNQPGAMMSYHKFIRLLHRTAIELDRPDFGIFLASRQGGTAVLGPLEIAMTNAATVGDAYHYCAEHLHAYSPAGDLAIETYGSSERPYIRWGIRLNRLPHQEQAIEHGIALMHHAIMAISGGAARAREVWFAHDHISSAAHYSGYFGTRVEMNAPFNAIFLNRNDLTTPITGRSQQVFDMATAFIDTQYPDVAKPFSLQVRSVATRLLSNGGCMHAVVASTLGMHPRTLQRRLREEGLSFEDIKDDVRRAAAIRYLGQTTIPLTRVATMLGYSESSVLTRSCHRWFGTSPRKYRNAIAINAGA